MSRGLQDLNPLERYLEASERAADQVIRAYSTSFGASTRFLGPRHRKHIRNIYALVRVADELVDGVGAEAKLQLSEQAERLDALEAETENAMRSGYSSNPIVHAFAATARLSRIDTSLTAPFFSSMRVDLRTVPVSGGDPANPLSVNRFDAEAHADYVYGSAEVIGLMCLRVFLRDERRDPDELRTLEHGARSLGAAFQNVNFLRDLADDTERLSRSYLSDDEVITEALKDRWIATIRQEIDDAEKVLPLLPRDARVAVDCALRLFARLTDKLDDSPVDVLLRRRVRVSNPEKALLILQSVAARQRKGSR